MHIESTIIIIIVNCSSKYISVVAGHYRGAFSLCICHNGFNSRNHGIIQTSHYFRNATLFPLWFLWDSSCCRLVKNEYPIYLTIYSKCILVKKTRIFWFAISHTSLKYEQSITWWNSAGGHVDLNVSYTLQWMLPLSKCVFCLILGVGFLNQLLLFRYFPNLSASQKHMLAAEHHFHI